MVDIKSGTEVYLKDGRRCFYRGMVDEDHIVEPYEGYHGWDGEWEEQPGGAILVPEVYPKPPEPVYDARIQEQKDQLIELEQRVDAAMQTLRDTETERTRILAKISQVPALKRIEDFIDGKCTHVVVETYGSELFEVKTLEEMQVYDHGYRPKKPEGIRLISLYGATNGDLNWRMNQWRDESGSFTMIVPCGSEEEGQAIAADLIAEQLRLHWPVDKERPYFFLRAARAAVLWNVPINSEQQAYFETVETDRRTKEIASLEKSKGEIQAKIDAISGAV